MIYSFFSLKFLNNKIIKFLLDIIFPDSKEERIISRLDDVFPLYISTHKILDKEKMYSIKKENRDSLKTKYEFKVTALSDYADYRVSALIHTLKYTRSKRSIQMIATVLGEFLLEEIASHITMYGIESVVIIPIPLSKKRKKERGFNQIELLLKEVSKKHTDIAPLIQTDILIKHKDTKPQTHLKREDRLKNVKGAFKIKIKRSNFSIFDPLVGKDIILIDDVVTTGATTLEASKTLIKAGARSVRIIAIARTL